MKKILATLILIFTLQTPSQADDIRDLQIEGMSLGDSALDYFTKNQINANKKNWYKNNEYSISEFRNLRSLKIYDDIHISYKSKDKKFILHAMEALVFYRNNIKDCLKKMDEIDSEFSNLFQNIKRLGKHKNRHSNPNNPGDNYVTDIVYVFDNGDRIILACYDWSIESGFSDHLRISLRTGEFRNFLRNKAYK